MLIKRHYYSAALAIHNGKCKSYRYSKLYAEK